VGVTSIGLVPTMGGCDEPRNRADRLRTRG
jgi:hypothetical protein